MMDTASAIAVFFLFLVAAVYLFVRFLEWLSREHARASWKQVFMWGLAVKWTRIASRIILLLGCGGLLTLLSGFYVKELEGMYLDVVPLEHESLRFGSPFPIFHSSAELWRPNNLFFDAQFVWLGALLDVLFYTFIVEMVCLIGTTLVKERAKRERAICVS